MKKFIKTCLFVALLTYCTKSTAQIDTSTTQKLLQYIFQPLDKNQIPTGYLEEYGCPMLPAETFNGTLTDSNRIDMNLWRTLYLQLQTGWTRTTANPLHTITTVNNTIKQNVSSTLPIPIPLLIGQYNTVKSSAFSSNLLSYNSSTKQLSDVTGRTQNPYNSKTLFAACPNKNITTTGSEGFIIQSSMIWNTTGKTISQIQINFADGQGFQAVVVGTPISITYTDTGYKKWTIKITLSDNSILQCYSDYYVLKAAGTAAKYGTFPSTPVVPAWGIIGATGVHKGATVTVYYSRLNHTGTLRKPLIVVEGYDVSFIASSLQPNYNVGDFIRAINEPQGYDFNSQLDDVAGYDLIFIDFFDGADDIISNAAIVQEVINRVNANKVNDNRFGNIRQQNVVMGLSMGGLCARYALANMTKNFPATPTETRLLITHDSPHRGANVPLGLQYMIRMLGSVQLFGYNVYDIYPDYNDAIGLLDAPATQQLLLYRANTTNTFVNNTFLDATYRPMITFGATGPQPTYRFIATANGNECANPLFNPGKTFINLGAGVSAGIYARFLFFKVPIVDYKLAAAVEAYALPAAGATNKIARVYSENNFKLFGFINIYKQLYNNTAYAPGTHLSVDGVPGSNYPLLNVDALNQLTELPIFKANLYASFPLGPFLGGYFGVYAYNEGVSYTFTFVPAASALDAGPYTTPIFSQKFVNGTNQNYPSTSETFIAQETVQNNASLTNNVHIRFTARNSRWLFNEMENRPNLENCSGECANAYFIKGDNIICTNSTAYTVPGLSNNATITWSVSPTGIANLSCTTCKNVILTKTINGVVTLTATINGGCSSSAFANPPTKLITIGAPAPSVTAIKSSQPGDPTTYDFTANTIPASTYSWYVNNVVQPNENYQTFDWYFPCNISKTIKCRINNVCGISGFSNSITRTGECRRTQVYRFGLSQNTMVRKYLDITKINLTDDEFAKLFVDESALAVEQIKALKVFDKEGNIMIENNGIDATQTNVDFTGLQEGVYTVELQGNNDYKEQRTFKYSIVKSPVEIAEEIATEALVIPTDDSTERKDVIKQQLYKELKTNDELLNSSEVLQQFFLKEKQGNFETIDEINKALSTNDIVHAQNIMNEWQPESQLDLNCFQYYNHYINFLTGIAFTNDDINDLYTLASKCPQIDGEIILAARSLYNHLTEANETFETACGGFASRTTRKEVNTIRHLPKTINIYPNPSKGMCYIDFPATEKGNNVITVLDMFGKNILQTTLTKGLNTVNLPSGIAAGTYIVRIINKNSGKQTAKKIMVKY